MPNVYGQMGRRVRNLRKKARLTQAQLAERAGITPDYMGRIERGQGAVTLETLNRIAKALGVPLRQFLDIREIASASREEILKSIQTILRKKDLEELRRIYAILEALEFE